MKCSLIFLLLVPALATKPTHRPLKVNGVWQPPWYAFEDTTQAARASTALCNFQYSQCFAANPSTEVNQYDPLPLEFCDSYKGWCGWTRELPSGAPLTGSDGLPKNLDQVRTEFKPPPPPTLVHKPTTTTS